MALGVNNSIVHSTCMCGVYTVLHHSEITNLGLFLEDASCQIIVLIWMMHDMHTCTYHHNMHILTHIHRCQLVSAGEQVDRGCSCRERERCHHYAGRQQDGLTGQEAGLDGGGREKGTRTQCHVHRDKRKGWLQRQTG